MRNVVDYRISGHARRVILQLGAVLHQHDAGAQGRLAHNDIDCGHHRETAEHCERDAPRIAGKNMIGSAAPSQIIGR